MKAINILSQFDEHSALVILEAAMMGMWDELNDGFAHDNPHGGSALSDVDFGELGKIHAKLSELVNGQPSVIPTGRTLNITIGVNDSADYTASHQILSQLHEFVMWLEGDADGDIIAEVGLRTQEDDELGTVLRAEYERNQERVVIVTWIGPSGRVDNVLDECRFHAFESEEDADKFIDELVATVNWRTITVG